MGNIEFLTRLLLADQFTFSEEAFKSWFELNLKQQPEGDLPATDSAPTTPPKQKHIERLPDPSKGLERHTRTSLKCDTSEGSRSKALAMNDEETDEQSKEMETVPVTAIINNHFTAHTLFLLPLLPWPVPNTFPLGLRA